MFQSDNTALFTNRFILIDDTAMRAKTATRDHICLMTHHNTPFCPSVISIAQMVSHFPVFFSENRKSMKKESREMSKTQSPGMLVCCEIGANTVCVLKNVCEMTEANSAETAACKHFPKKYFLGDKSVSLKMDRVCAWTEIPPNPNRNAATVNAVGKLETEFWSAAIPDVISNTPPKRTPRTPPDGRMENKCKISVNTAKNSTKAHTFSEL